MNARIIKGEGHIKNMTFEGYGIQIRPVKTSDLPALRRWRNSPDISQQMADTSHITQTKQRLWYERIINSVEEAFEEQKKLLQSEFDMQMRSFVNLNEEESQKKLADLFALVSQCSPLSGCCAGR